MDKILALLRKNAFVLHTLRDDPSLLLEGVLLASEQDWEEGTFACRAWSSEEVLQVLKTVSALLEPPTNCN